jgi:3-mercaptopyruvate sulfurtransferase SseA
MARLCTTPPHPPLETNVAVQRSAAHGAGGQLQPLPRQPGVVSLHIKGDIPFDPLTCGLRTGADEGKPYTLTPHSKVAEIFGGLGIDADEPIIVYDQNGTVAGALIAVLEWADATQAAYLKGGIEGWHHAGFHNSTQAAIRQACVFGGKGQTSWIEDSDGVARLSEKRGTVILDSRLIDRFRA